MYLITTGSLQGGGGILAKKNPIIPNFVFSENKKFVAHDETNDCNAGDTVRIMETRPISKRKRWRLVEIIERAK